MNYEILALDLDGTLTNSQKEITAPTKKALIEIQERGKKVILASGRPTAGIVSLARELELARFGSYILSFNGGRIINCKTGEIIYNKTLPLDIIGDIYEIVKSSSADILTYTEDAILSGIQKNEYTEIEAFITHLPVVQSENILSDFNGHFNKFLIAGDPADISRLEPILKEHFHGFLNFYQSSPYFLEVMPQNIDKAYSLQKLLNSLGMTADEMICCGDGHNDISMIEYAGLGVAMQNAEPIVLKSADYVTKSNDNDGVLHVINQFMR